MSQPSAAEPGAPFPACGDSQPPPLEDANDVPESAAVVEAASYEDDGGPLDGYQPA